MTGNHSGTPTAGRGLVSVDDVRAAALRLDGVIRKTPLTRADAIGKVVGRPLLLKPELFQRAGSFKIRGAYNRISQLPDDVPVVAASAGNHAQGVALAATLTQRQATIFMPATAPLPKVRATSDYGAEIRFVDGLVDDCIVTARRFAEETGAVLVHPFDDPLVIAGQGTVGLELLEEAPEAEVVLVPVGGGGLASGIAVALQRRARVIGIRPASVTATMADGIAVKAPSELTHRHLVELLDDMITVTEEEISQAVVMLLERAKMVVEPAGAVGLAALLGGRIAGSGAAVAVLSGGNVDPLLLTKLVEHGLSAAGRYLVLRVVLADRPGALAALTAELATRGLNVLSVEHHRFGLSLAVDEVEVLVTLETRDPEHRDEVVASLGDGGYRVELVR